MIYFLYVRIVCDGVHSPCTYPFCQIFIDLLDVREKQKKKKACNCSIPFLIFPYPRVSRNIIFPQFSFKAVQLTTSDNNKGFLNPARLRFLFSNTWIKLHLSIENYILIFSLASYVGQSEVPALITSLSLTLFAPKRNSRYKTQNAHLRYSLCLCGCGCGRGGVQGHRQGVLRHDHW